LISPFISNIDALLVKDLVVPTFKKFKLEIHELYQKCKDNEEGKISNSIPELEKANPESFGVSICTIDG
jgi:glutaminase